MKNATENKEMWQSPKLAELDVSRTLTGQVQNQFELFRANGDLFQEGDAPVS